MTKSEIRKRQVVAVLEYPDDMFGKGTAWNAVTALGQSRFEYATYNISRPLPELEAFTAVLICTERLDMAPPDTATPLATFVRNGGGLVVLHRGLHDQFCDLFGVLRQDRSAAVGSDHDTAGLHFPSRVFPSFEGMKLEATSIDGHAAFDLVPAADTRVVATTWTGKPLSWRTEVGNGYVLYWNTTIFGSSRTRGLIVESLASVTPVSVTPFANAGVIQVDDFPAPLALPGADLVAPAPPEDFFGRVWWPDVHRLTTRYDIPLNCFVMFDYSDVGADDHTNPFSMIESENHAAIKRLPPAEIGLHGYNHTPLAREYWPDQTKMLRSVELAMAEWTRAGLGPLPTSYVPPMNVYDANGIAALVEAVPSLSVISGALEGSMGGPTEREFGPEPWNDTLFNLPRATSGYECSAELLFDCANVVSGLGVWTHFLHPDDLMDVPGPVPGPEAPRNPFGRPWRGRNRQPGLYDQFASILFQVKARFPWLVYRTTTDAAKTVRQFLESEWRTEIGPDNVIVEGPVGGFFRLRTNGAIPGRVVACEGAEIVHQQSAEDFNLYVIQTQAATVEITLTREAPASTYLDRIIAALRPDRHPAAG